MNPDGAKAKEALEAKYSEDYALSIYNHEKKYVHQVAVDKMADQAQKYLAYYTKGVTYVTNDAQLASIYTRLFENRGLSNFRLVIRVKR